MARVCGRQPRANALWLWWYAGMVVAAFGYLLYRAIVKCSQFNSSPWPDSERPITELYVYIVLVVVAVVCMPIFVIAAVMRVGNLANDGFKLGRDGVREALGKTRDEGEEVSDARGWRGVWRRLGPIAPALHVVTAFCLLLPRPLLQAQEVRHRLVPFEKTWSTELDFLFGPGRLTTYNVTYRLAATRNEKDTAALPANVNMTMYLSTGLQLTTETETVEDGAINYAIVSPEFINYVIALIVYSVRYSAVFWFTHKGFTLLFSTQLLAGLVNYMFCYCGFSVIYKYALNQNSGPGSLRLPLPHPVIVTLFILSCSFIFFSSISVFNLGYYHFDKEYRTFLRNHRVQVSNRDANDCCQGYAPHCMASVMLLVIVCCKAPVMYCYFSWYGVTRDKLILSGIVCDVLYFFLWVVMWLGFTIKHKWTFYIIKPFVKIYTIPNDHNICDDVISRPYSATSFNNNNEMQQTRHVETPSDEAIEVNDFVDRPDSGCPGDGDVFNADHGVYNVSQGVYHVDHSLSTESVNSQQPANDPPPQHLQEPPIPRPTVSSSALRRSGNRKQKNNNNRVTFEDFEAKHPGDSPHESLRSVRSPQTRPRRPVSSDNSRVQLRQQSVDGALSRDNPNRRSDPGPRSAILPGCDDIKPRFFNETPENTLTRNYRHSIRSKCDQYYVNPNVSNAPQMSPVLQERANKNGSITRTIVNEHCNRQLSHNGEAKNKRNRSPPRNNKSSHVRSRENLKNYRTIIENNSIRTPTSETMTRDLSRELKIITKPDMGGRDSAVPSSNETSSNDSEESNVLCSQV